MKESNCILKILNLNIFPSDDLQTIKTEKNCQGRG